MRRQTIVDVEKLNVRFGDFYAVRDVSFSVAPGEIFGFLGANGAGKTTTIRVLCGIIAASSGRVVIDGVEFKGGNQNLIKRRVGYMSQKFTLYDELTIAENFAFAASLRGLSHAEYIKNRDSLLRFIGFDKDLSALVTDLPGGIKQEIALCVSLLHNPAIIFLDEPTAGVAPVARSKFWQLIRELSKSGKTVFVTTHYMDEAENCHRIALMRAGELIALDSPTALKRATFGDTLLRFTPRYAGAKLPPANYMEICEPYGRHWHIKFKPGVNMAKYSHDFEIVHISPSLEDVFIKLVEGGAR